MKQTLKYILERLIENRKFAEEKHSITLALSSGVIIFFSGFIGNQNQIVTFLSALSVIFALISVLYSFFALTAKRFHINNRAYVEKVNLFDYKFISKFDEDDYLKTMKKVYNFPNSYKIDDFDRDLARQVISLAKAIRFKFMYFNLALVFLSIGISLGVVVIVLLGVL